MELYTIDSDLWFGVNGNANEYKIKGWHRAEKDLNWIDGKSAVLYIPFANPLNSHDLTLKAKLAAFICSAVKKQVVEIYVNGKKAGEWTFSSTTPPEQILKISNDLISSQHGLEIAFNVPFAVSPKFMGISADERIMGAAVAWMKIS